MLTGVREGAVIKRLPGVVMSRFLLLQTGGNSGERWWFLNGEPLSVKGRIYTLQLDKSGDYQLLVMDETGAGRDGEF